MYLPAAVLLILMALISPARVMPGRLQMISYALSMVLLSMTFHSLRLLITESNRLPGGLDDHPAE
jgi:hypothetical protein